MFLSIIIPVFNVESWLPRCIENVIKAAPEDSEIILVTTDSSDKSNSLCAEYANSDTRILMIKQNGHGLANARNCGYDISRGEFINYIDSDDYIDIGLFAGLLERLRLLDGKFDVAMTDYRQVTTTGKIINEDFQIGSEIEIAEGEEFLEHVLKKKKSFWNVWRYTYRRSFIESNGIRFKENVLSEDMDYTAKVYSARPRFVFMHCPYYNYCVGRGDSLMDRPTYKRLFDTIDNIKLSIELFEKAGLTYSNALISQYQYEYMLNLAQCVEIEPEDRAKALDLFKQTFEILCVGNFGIAHIFHIVFRVLPIASGSWALHFMKIIKRRLRGDLRETRPSKGRKQLK